MPQFLAPIFIAIGASAAAAAAISSAIFYGLLSVGLSLVSTFIQSMFAKKPTVKPSEYKTVIKQSAAPRRRSYGLTMVGGVMAMIEENGGGMGMVIATGQGQINRVITHYVDGVAIPTTVYYQPNWKGNYLKKNDDTLYLTESLGQTTPNSHIFMKRYLNWAWTDSHIGRDINSVGIYLSRPKAEYFNKSFPNGARIEYKQLREGALVYDPRTKKTVYSNNAALCIRDYLISEYGMKLPEKFISLAEDDWIKAANICDEQIPLKAGGYEARYRIGMTYQLNEKPSDVLRRMLNACDAEIFPTPNGGITIKVGKWEEPTITLDEHCITGITNLTKGAGFFERYNTIRAQYTSPDHEFEEVDADPWVDDESVSEFGEISQDTQLYEVPSHGQARRLLKRVYYGINTKTRMTITTNLSGLAVFGQRFIRVKNDEFGIDDTFEVQGQPQCVMGENSVIIGMQIDLIAIGYDAFSWNPAKEEGDAAGVPIGTAPKFVMPIPTGLSVIREERKIGGSTLYYAVFKADIPQNGNYIRYEISDDNGKNWTNVLGNSDTTVAEYGALVDGKKYQFRARTVSVSGSVESDPTGIINFESGNAPELSTNGNFAFEGGWDKGNGWSLNSGSASKKSGEASNLTQSTNTVIAGRSYRISFTIVSQFSGDISVGLFGGITVKSGAYNVPNNYTIELSAPANVTKFGFIANSDTELTVTNFSIKEVL